MSHRRVRVLAGVAGGLVVGSLALVPLSASAVTTVSPTATGVPHVSTLVAVAAHRLGDVKVAGKGASSFAALGVDGIPTTGVAAVAIKLTASKPGAAGALVAYPTGSARPGVLSVSFVAGHDATGVVVVAPGTKGRVSVYNASTKSARIIPTVVGYYRTLTSVAPAGTYLRTVAPRALVSVVVPAHGSATVTAAGVKGVPATGTTGVVFELSAVNPVKAGVLTVTPSGSAKSKVVALSFTAGHSATNLVTAAAGSGGHVVVASSAAVAVRVRLDVIGYRVVRSVPGAPAPVAATSPLAGQVNVTWSAPDNGGSAITGYTVTPSSGLPLTVAGTVTSHTFTGLGSGQSFKVTVRATNYLGSSLAAASPVVIVKGAAGSNVTSAVSVDTAEGYHGSGVTTATPASSASGRYVAFSSASALVDKDTNGFADVFLRDRSAGTTIRLSNDADGKAPAKGASTDVSISADGATVAFDSTAPDLVADDTNGRSDVFVWTTAGISRVSLTDTGAQGGPAGTVEKESKLPAISADGRYVAFLSNVPDFISTPVPQVNTNYNVYVRDLTDATTTLVSQTTAGLPLGTDVTGRPSISADGRFIAYTTAASDVVANDTNGVSDVFVYDQTTKTTTRVSVDSSAAEADGASSAPVLSSDGHYVAFQSAATNLVAGDTNGQSDVFLRDTVLSTTSRVSVTDGDTQANGASTAPSISDDGTQVLFTSAATNLVVGDTNGQPDAFVRLLVPGATIRASLAVGELATGGTAATLAPGGSVAFFTSTSAIAATDTNAKADLFARTLG